METYFNHFSIELTPEQAISASHPGPCDSDVAILVEEIRPQLESLDPDDIAAELADYGAWSAEELQNTEENYARITWIAAGYISEELEQGV